MAMPGKGKVSIMNKYEIILYWSEEDKAILTEVSELAGCQVIGVIVGLDTTMTLLRHL